MQCTNLLRDLDFHIINDLLNKDNCTMFYYDSLLFYAEPFRGPIVGLIECNIDSILQKQELY